MTAVWAYSKAAPGKTCEDARLLGDGTQLQFPQGNDKGQAGWDVGLMFDTFADLAQKITSLLGRATGLGDRLRPVGHRPAGRVKSTWTIWPRATWTCRCSVTGWPFRVHEAVTV